MHQKCVAWNKRKRAFLKAAAKMDKNDPRQFLIPWYFRVIKGRITKRVVNNLFNGEGPVEWAKGFLSMTKKIQPVQPIPMQSGSIKYVTYKYSTEGDKK